LDFPTCYVSLANTPQCLGCGTVSSRRILLYDALVRPVAAILLERSTPAKLGPARANGGVEPGS